ncbi:hypothetical protein D9611_004011 [Ephemerocybe angulata]|uniref:Potassium transport protein n=1 Tax=Ephemerocybe angulata TaxID=980116 RepID=A0A8H5B5Y8_9AGAR|nr:hypothetical protein D9611_004011 [Tulosesus angulatus]
MDHRSAASKLSEKSESLGRLIRKELNFYRIHLIFFTVTPLFFSVIFYLSNGRYKISYIDSLFNCVSSITVCGLATVDLSTLTPWQQVILFIQMCIGSPIVASWLVVFNRRRYIRTNCSRIFADFVAKKEQEAQSRGSWRRLLNLLGIPSPTPSVASDEENTSEKHRGPRSGAPGPLRADMVRRMDHVEPKLINPSGLVTGESGATPGIHVTGATPPGSVTNANATTSISRDYSGSSDPHITDEHRKGDPSAHVGFPRTMTVEFGDLPKPRTRNNPIIPEQNMSDTDRASRHFSTNLSLSNHPTHQSYRTHHSTHTHTHHSLHNAKHTGYGGFPMPHTIIKRLFRKAFPNLDRKLTRTLTVPVTMSFVSVPTRQPGEKQATYLPSDAMKVGRNSQFDVVSMTQDQLIEIAYLEYQALGLLLWVIPAYHFGCQLLAFIVIAPYISTPRWHETFVPPNLVRSVNPVWFSAFQTVSAYTNTGTSLVDQSMLPFQEAYPMIFFLIFLILAGNTCFPILLRLVIWCMAKASKRGTDLNNVTYFLLDHPRRCYIYLFPSHQTWFLLTVVLLLTTIDWFFFLILDLGNEAISAIPTGVRVLAGFMQSIAVRAAGFGIVPLGALAPAVKVLYVIMMYISVYPIAMSIRSTNVYEEKSLGIFHEDVDGEEEFENRQKGEEERTNIFGRYLAMHARQQLAFDMWWIAISLFVLCIAEGHNLTNPEKFGWFTIFNLLFELVSAYGTVGLSLGLPTNNYSFAGALRTISKLVICAVMIRGRHRGLPVAIDRAVMFPSEYQDPDKKDADDDSAITQPDLHEERGHTTSLPFHHDSAPDALETKIRRQVVSNRRSANFAESPISDNGFTIPSGQPSFAFHSRLEDIPQGGSKPNSVNTWRHNVKSSNPSIESFRGDASSFASYHRSDTSSSHREPEEA